MIARQTVVPASLIGDGGSPTPEILEPQAQALVDHALETLASESAELGARMAAACSDEIKEIAAAVQAEPDFLGELADRCQQFVTILVDYPDEAGPPAPEDLAFVHEIAMRRASEGFPIEALLHAIRVGQRVIWERMARDVGRDTGSAEALAWLTKLSIRHADGFSAALTGTYLRTLQARTANAERRRLELLDEALAGQFPSRPDSVALAAALGFAPDAKYAVLVIAVADSNQAGDSSALEQLRAELERYIVHRSPRPLVITRGREVIVLAADTPAGAEALASSIAQAVFAASGSRCAIGISGACSGLREVAQCHTEAFRALAFVRQSGGVASFDQIRLFDYLTRQAGQTARRLLPAGVATLVEHTPGREALATTLSAYFDCDLSVLEAAQQLSVHPNTVRYRLARIEEITGLDTRNFWDLAELAAALQLVWLDAHGREPDL